MAKETSDRRPSIQSVVLSALSHLGRFLCGLLPIFYGLFAILYQVFLLVGPCTYLYVRMVLETADWKASQAMAPCLQLWKDGLEDELWRF